ncbi:MAG: stage V sporulation protein AE [Candidatus Paraimprobicoccus trichonymphae]|uniref:Stage V sporulation protein AE n=1 Tax=Candidatus Paraimprobicoccus trichonymphae TaxID=3033793 RepID=A0AA48KZV6_9FIRM|nr:MAG: stage V sporulation protein AE [Candidatus Paraimprobicoccus trichonymphae]
MDFSEYIRAFITGGFLCALAQILIDKTKLTPARILVSFVTLGVILTALGFYESLVKFGGAGATVPLSGFGFLMAKGVHEAIKQQGVLGILTGGFTSVSAGITSAIFFGYVFALLSKSKDKSV